MTTHSTHYLFDDARQIWHRPGATSIAYSDGNATEQRIAHILKNAQDVSAGSDELCAHITDWPTEYHFTPNRHNLLRAFPFNKNQKILELGSGCGAITRQLGESGATISAVEGSLCRASITAERCRDLPNVNVYCDNLIAFETAEQFDVVLLIGVLEYSRVYINDPQPELACLKKALSHLKKGGHIILAIENQLGLKYFNGVSEDHIGIPFYGINDLYGKNTAATFGKKELSQLLKKAGCEHLDFYYPFPDYKIPNTIFSTAGLNTPELNVANLLMGLSSRDYGNDKRQRSFNEHLTWQTLARNNLVGELSNSFLIFASPDEKALPDCAWLNKYYNTSRPKCQMKESTISTTANTLQVTQQLIFANNEKSEPQQFLMKLPLSNQYITGDSYLLKLISSLTGDNDIAIIIDWLKPWLNFLIANALDAGKNDENILMLPLPNNFIDCIPKNLIQDAQGTLHYFDDEWHSKQQSIPLYWVFIRGIIHTFNTPLLIPKGKKKTHRTLLREIFNKLDLPFSKTLLQKASEQEDALRHFVHAKKLLPFDEVFDCYVAGYTPIFENNLNSSLSHDAKLFLEKKLKSVYRRLPLPQNAKANLRNIYFHVATLIKLRP